MYDYLKKAERRTLAVRSQFPFVGAAKSHPVNKKRDAIREDVDIQERAILISAFAAARYARENILPAEERPMFLE